MIDQVLNIVQKAGNAIMQIYKSADFDIEVKSDDSPLTTADIAANRIITGELKKAFNLPVVSEESPVDYKIRKNWNKFWLVDPLDGTKDFIQRNDQFTINIALIENNKPILGVVNVPAMNIVYWAVQGQGAFKNGNKIYNHGNRTELIGADSNFHSTPEVKLFFKQYNINHVINIGSAIKICMLAEGEIDVYPRFNGTKEWDTAAAHIIANEGGCCLMDIKTKKELVYNKEDIKNNYFIAHRKNLHYESYYISSR